MVASRDLISGVVFLVFGAALAWKSSEYQMGTLLQMGPGYYPFLIGVGIAAVGAVLAVKALVSGSEGFPVMAWRPLFFILAAIVVFGLSLERLGLVASTALLMVVGRFASPRPLSWIATFALTAALAVASVLIFRSLLGLQLRVWP